MSFSTIAIAASAKAGIQSKEDANIIEFVEAPWGLGMTLFPVQKVILKAHYGLELDDTKKFKISDWRRENWKELTEKEYLKHIYDLQLNHKIYFLKIHRLNYLKLKYNNIPTPHNRVQFYWISF